MNFTNIIIILGIALVLFGPDDLPKFARALGKIIGTIRRMTGEFTKEFGSLTDAPEKVLMKAFDSPKPSSTANKSAAVETFAEDGEDDEELLTYDPPAPTQPSAESAVGTDADPLADLPADMVSYEKVKDTSR